MSDEELKHYLKILKLAIANFSRMSEISINTLYGVINNLESAKTSLEIASKVLDDM